MVSSFGASNAVPETIEASLQLSEAVLVDVGVPVASIHEKRASLQATIKVRVGAPATERS
jgi:monovalent cation:H+ antiporter-2, CPA2 family